jgi:endonuclease YncB( thermonuclease family)
MLMDDPGSPEDTRGRRLAYAFRPGDRYSINYELARLGWAYARRDIPHPHMAAFLAAKADAREHGRGLWPMPAPEVEPAKPVDLA